MCNRAFKKNIISKAIVIIAGIAFLSGCAASRKVPMSPGDISSAVNMSDPIAVLPVENLSGIKAPLKEIRELLISRLKGLGFNIINDDILERFMSRRRIRYTGAVNREDAEAFKKEIGAAAVLITSVELYSDSYPPKISLISRLTSTGSAPEILWMDSIGISGDDSPGILGLGLTENPDTLLQKSLQYLSGSLVMNLSGGKKTFERLRKMGDKRPALIVSVPDKTESPVKDTEQVEVKPVKAEFIPKVFYRSPILSAGMKYRIAVMPFLNKSDRKHAGEIMSLQFVNELREFDYFDVIEPGMVRENLLRFRIIMNEGISFDNAGLIFSTLETEADLILSGTVIDYQDYQGPVGAPKVDFSVLVIEKKSREVVWTSKSYRAGNEGVIFFDRGRINVAHPLASRMARGVVETLITE